MTTSFVDESGTTRLRGTLVPPPGGSQPSEGQYGGNGVLVNDGALGTLTVDTLNAGTALLDLSNPAAPTFVAAGIYALTAVIGGDALTAGGKVQGGLQIAGGASVNAGSTIPEFSFVLTVVQIVPLAGDNLVFTVFNNDGVAARNFSLSTLIVVKLA